MTEKERIEKLNLIRDLFIIAERRKIKLYQDIYTSWLMILIVTIPLLVVYLANPRYTEKLYIIMTTVLLISYMRNTLLAHMTTYDINWDREKSLTDYVEDIKQQTKIFGKLHILFNIIYICEMIGIIYVYLM